MNEILPILRALADPTRFVVFQCIRGCGGTEGGAAACDIRCQVPCAPSTLTHHLNILREAGLIETQKRGRIVYAKIRSQALQRLTVFFSPQTK